MSTTPDDRLPVEAQATARRRKRGGLRRTWKCLKELVGELVGEFVGEMLVQVLSCLLLLGVALGLIWGWRRSPELTLGAIAVLLIGTVTAITAWRHPGPLRARRMGATLLTVLLVLALWFILYGSNCGCV
ncbi:hypothetical protein ACFXBB_01665 [Streptomyces scopuliridis]|uniref:hypothetical protein n=1 Tax=Streptomyces scopuliridis TaxID=452529 RepID=UPI0036AE237E